MAPQEHNRRVVAVAVDGSEPSTEALEWAATEARLRKATLRVIHTWMMPALGSAAGYVPAAVYEDFPRNAEATVDSQLRDVLGTAHDPVVERVVLEGSPVQTILDATKDADLLVVGSRGRGGFAGTLLGSVSTGLVHHAHIPVVIVRS